MKSPKPLHQSCPPRVLAVDWKEDKETVFSHKRMENRLLMPSPGNTYIYLKTDRCLQLADLTRKKFHSSRIIAIKLIYNKQAAYKILGWPKINYTQQEEFDSSRLVTKMPAGHIIFPYKWNKVMIPSVMLWTYNQYSHYQIFQSKLS